MQDSGVISWDVWSRVVEFAGERTLRGTAFVVGSGEDQILVTARHLCTDEPEEILTIRHPWTNGGFAYQIAASRVGMDVAPGADFAIFRMAKPIDEVGVDVPFGASSFYYSQNAFILGYPFGLSSEPDGASPQRIPIVKGCTISGTTTSSDDITHLYIDAVVNPGFSGGPLVYVDLSTKESKFAGVVVKGMWAPLHEPTDEEPDPPQGPAGIGVVVSARTFRQALPGLPIDEHVPGPLPSGRRPAAST